MPGRPCRRSQNGEISRLHFCDVKKSHVEIHRKPYIRILLCEKHIAVPCWSFSWEFSCATGKPFRVQSRASHPVIVSITMAGIFPCGSHGIRWSRPVNHRTHRLQLRWHIFHTLWMTYNVSYNKWILQNPPAPEVQGAWSSGWHKSTKVQVYLGGGLYLEKTSCFW